MVASSFFEFYPDLKLFLELAIFLHGELQHGQEPPKPDLDAVQKRQSRKDH